MADAHKPSFSLAPPHSPSRKASQHVAGPAKGMTVSELCTLAPWDELAAFRREVQLKLEEAFTMVQERREGENRVLQTCQQLEAKVERFARQTRGLHSRSEVFEGHLTGQAKELDVCKESQEALRERLQRAALEWTTTHNTSTSSMRTELDEAVEQRHELALEACRRGDRAIADELLKKMGELNEKLGANMLSLEEELVTDFKKLRVELERQEKLRLELTDAQASAAAGVEARLAKVQGDMEKVEVHGGSVDRLQSEHAGRLSDAEVKLVKLQEHVSRLEGRMNGTEQANASKLEQLKEQVDEGAEQTSAGLARLRSEAEATMRDAVRSSREDLREDIRTMREEFSKNLHETREDLRSNLTGCRDFAQALQQEALTGLAEVKGDFRTLCRDVCGRVEDVQQQVSNLQTETKSNLEAGCRQLQQEIDTRLQDITSQLTALREEASQTNANDRLVTLAETMSGTQQRLGEASVSISRLRLTSEEITADVSKCRTFSESGISDLRREAERQESGVKRHLKDTLDAVQQQLDVARGEGQERTMLLQKEFEEFVHRVSRNERSGETQTTELREQLRERLRESAQSLTKMHTESQGMIEERLQSLARQSDAAVSAVRSELSKAAALARESRAESERTCHRFMEEVAHNQETRLAEGLAAEKAASGTALNEAFTELLQELQAVRGTLANQAADSVGRTEQLASETQKQTEARSEDLKQMIEELQIKIDEQFNAFASNTRHTLQESRQELRQQITRQLEENVRPLSDRLAETAGDFHALKRTEKNSSERLQNTCSELAATQESLARVTQQCSAQNAEILELRAGLRNSGELQARLDPLCRPDPLSRLERGASRERATEFRSFRDEFQVRTDVSGYLNEASTRLGTKVEIDAPARLAPKTEGGDWSFSGTARELPRHKPRASFEAVMGASPLRARDGECFVRRSRTPSPTQQALGGRLEDNWTFGLPPQETRRRTDALGSPRGTQFGGRITLGTTPPRSPHTIHTARGSYL